MLCQIVNIATGETKEASNLDWGTSPVLDTYEDKIIIWVDHSKSINLYDCVTDASIQLYNMDPKSTDIINNGCIANNSFYFIEGSQYGILKVIEDFDIGEDLSAKQVEGANRNIITVDIISDTLICAVRERSESRDSVSFYYISPDRQLAQLATWEDSHYWSLGSLRMTVADGLLAACLTTQDDVFTYEFT